MISFDSYGLESGLHKLSVFDTLFVDGHRSLMIHPPSLPELRGILDFFFGGVDLAFLLIIKKYLHVIENEELKYPCMFLTNPDPKLLTSNDRGSFF